MANVTVEITLTEEVYGQLQAAAAGEGAEVFIAKQIRSAVGRAAAMAAARAVEQMPNPPVVIRPAGETPGGGQ
jgi:hypothetical protein